MSTEAFHRILTRAASDAAFADLLFADPEQALAGCDLTLEERFALHLLSRSDLIELAFAPRPGPLPPVAGEAQHRAGGT